MDGSAYLIAFVVGVFLFGGLVKGLVGVGLPTVVLALLIHSMPLREAVPLLVIPAIGTNIWQAFAGGHLQAALKRFWLLLVLLIVGTWIGVGILNAANPKLLSALFGVILVAYGLIGLLRPVSAPPGRAEPWLNPVIGFTNGILNGLTGSYILPGTIYLQSLGLPRDELIQSMGILFLVASAALAISLAGHSVMGWREGLMSAAVLLPTMLGYGVGQHYRRKLPEATFRRLFFVGLVLLGGYTVFGSVWR